MSDDTSRPDWACLLCPPPQGDKPWREADNGYTTCERCLKKLRQVIADVSTYYRRLDPTPGAVSDNESRGAPGFRSQPAANLHIVTMRDPRSVSYEVSRDGHTYTWVNDPNGWSPELPEGVHGPVIPPGRYEKHDVWFGADGRAHTEQARPPRSIPKAIQSIAQWVAEDRDMTPPAGNVSDLCHWLDVHCDYVTRQPWVTDFDEELRSIRAQLKPVAGDGRKHKILSCPNVVDEGEHTRVCGANLYEPDRNGTIRCHACKREWPRDKWEGDGPEYLSQLADDNRARLRTA